MKNLCIIFLLSFIAFSTNAQTTQGNKMVGGALSISSTNVDGVDGSLNTIRIQPIGGYFVIDKLLAGLNLGYGYSKRSDSDNGTTELAIGPFARYYMTTNGGLFGEALFGYQSRKIGDNDSVSGTVLGLGVGYAVFLNNHISIEPKISYLIGGGDLIGDTRALNFSVGFGMYLD